MILYTYVFLKAKAYRWNQIKKWNRIEKFWIGKEPFQRTSRKFRWRIEKVKKKAMSIPRMWFKQKF